jgi:transglutaminase 1
VLAIVHVDYCLDDNGDEHRTSRYDLMNRELKEARLVARRGQPFILELHLSRNYDPAIDGISIVFTLEGVKKPQYGHRTLVASALLHPGEVSDGAWQTVIEAYAENSLRIKVCDPSSALRTHGPTVS